MVGGVCGQCGLPDSHEQYASVMDLNIHPVLRLGAPPRGPGPITAFEEAVKGGLEAYDAIKEPATMARDIAVKGVFAGLRRLLYRRK